MVINKQHSMYFRIIQFVFRLSTRHLWRWILFAIPLFRHAKISILWYVLKPLFCFLGRGGFFLSIFSFSLYIHEVKWTFFHFYQRYSTKCICLSSFSVSLIWIKLPFVLLIQVCFAQFPFCCKKNRMVYVFLSVCIY